MQFTSTQKRATAWGLIAVFSAFALWLLTPFVVAAILAYALTPLVNWLDRLGRGRLPRMVPILAKELPLMREQVPVLLDGLNASLKLGGSVAFAILGNAILIPVALFYLLMDWNRFVAQLLEFVPLPIGIFTGLAIFIPCVGFDLGLILATLAGFLEFAVTAGPAKALIMVAVVYGLGQLIESLFLTPRLVGERIGLHPLAVIFALPASAVLLLAMRRARARYLCSKLYQG